MSFEEDPFRRVGKGSESNNLPVVCESGYFPDPTLGKRHLVRGDVLDLASASAPMTPGRFVSDLRGLDGRGGG